MGGPLIMASFSDRLQPTGRLMRAALFKRLDAGFQPGDLLAQLVGDTCACVSSRRITLTGALAADTLGGMRWPRHLRRAARFPKVIMFAAEGEVVWSFPQGHFLSPHRMRKTAATQGLL
jgi:hypothetical protein